MGAAGIRVLELDCRTMTELCDNVFDLRGSKHGCAAHKEHTSMCHFGHNRIWFCYCGTVDRATLEGFASFSALLFLAKQNLVASHAARFCILKCEQTRKHKFALGYIFPTRARQAVERGEK